MRNFGLQVPFGAVRVDKGSGGFHDDLFPPGHFKLHVSADAAPVADARLSAPARIPLEHAPGRNALLQADHEMPAVSGRLSPALVDAVHGIISPNHPPQGVYLNIPLSLVAVGIHHQVAFPRPGVGEAEDSRARASRHFSPDAFIGQGDGVVSGCGFLLAMAERDGATLRPGAQRVVQRHQRHRAVVLRTAPYNPVGSSEALQQRVGIIIRSDALLLGVPGLRRPEVHAVRLQDGGQRLAVFFRTLAEESGRTGRAGSRADACVNAVIGTDEARWLVRASRHTQDGQQDRQYLFHSLI